MTSERSLTLFEALFARIRIGPVVVNVTLDGPVDTAVLDRAARLLQRDYPVLRCSLHEAEDGVTLALEEEGPGLVLDPPGEDPLTHELNMPVTADRPVNRIALVRNGNSAVLSLAGDHAATDARLNTLLLHRLLDYYTDLLDGREPEPTGRSAFEGSLEEALVAGFETPRAEQVNQQQAAPSDQTPLALAGQAAAPGPLAVHSFSYDPDTTAALIAAARRGGISVTNLLSGALACAVRARFAADLGPLPIAPAFAVDLRPRVEPPIPADAPFVCVSRQVCDVTVDAGDDPVEVGRRIGTQLQGALQRNEIQHRLLAQRHGGRPVALPPISYLVSNIGVVEDYRVPDGLRVTGSRWSTTSRGPVPTLFGLTAYGSLNLELVYDTAFLAAEVMAEVAKHFDAALLGCR